jgi:hypothetical protein
MKVAVALMERQLGPCYECLVVNSVPNVVICRVYVLWFECNVYIMLEVLPGGCEVCVSAIRNFLLVSAGRCRVRIGD